MNVRGEMRPLSIPLPVRKKLFLALGKSGTITRRAAERPAVVKPVESGEVFEEISQREGARRVAKIETDAPSYTGSKYSVRWSWLF